MSARLRGVVSEVRQGVDSVSSASIQIAKAIGARIVVTTSAAKLDRCRELGADLQVIRNDEMTTDEIAALNPEKIILSPGPATPDEAGVTLEVIERFAGGKPIFGICLGHQSIAQAFGGEVIRAKRMMHGKTSQVKVTEETPIFRDLPKEFRATRYHSLVVRRENLPDRVVPTAVSTDDGEIMALKIRDLPVYGVQFHPESIMSEHGHAMLDNFLKL